MLKLLETSFSPNMDRIAIHKQKATLVLLVFGVVTNERDSPDKKTGMLSHAKSLSYWDTYWIHNQTEALRLNNISQTMKKNNKQQNMGAGSAELPAGG